MKTMFAAAMALVMGTGTAWAQGGSGPHSAPITAFVIWQTEGAAGKPLTPMAELIRKARKGVASNNAPQLPYARREPN